MSNQLPSGVRTVWELPRIAKQHSDAKQHDMRIDFKPFSSYLFVGPECRLLAGPYDEP
jgi:hypothetical protein